MGSHLQGPSSPIRIPETLGYVIPLGQLDPRRLETDRVYRNVGNKLYRSALRKMPKERESHLDSNGILETRTRMHVTLETLCKTFFERAEKRPREQSPRSDSRGNTIICKGSLYARSDLFMAYVSLCATSCCYVNIQG